MIPEIAPYNNYTGDGSTTQFDFDFYIEDASQLVVQKTKSDGEIVTLTKDTDYSIHEVGNTSGSYITFPIEGSSYSKLASDEVISLMLTLPISQESEYGTSSELDLKSLEYSLDYLTRICQIQNRQLTRAIKVQEGSNITTDELAVDLTTVADIRNDISTVAGISGDVTAVKNNATNISTVAGSIDNVNAVGGSIANVNAVKADLTNVDTVAGSIANVNAVGADIANVNAVAADLTNIDAVKADLTNIDAVNSNKTNIDTVAGIASDVSTVAGISADVTAVKNNATNINSVAGDLTSIAAVAADLTNIDAASSNAALAKNWANKTDGTVDGSEYSAKYYAQQAAQGQVQANWAETDTTSKAYINNKPTIPDAQIQSDWSQSDNTKKDFIKNKPDLSTKQDTLVSGTNIKTINNNSILGSGNLDIDALPSQTGNADKFLKTDGTNASWATVEAGANKDLQNLTTLGNARLQYAPFAINAGTVLNGKNNTLTYSGSEITCDPCTITTCDGRTKIFNTSTTLDCSTQADGNYSIFKNAENGALSLVSGFSMSNTIPINVNITGTLTNNNGVLSGFSENNYASLPNVFSPNSNSWEIVSKIKTKSDFSVAQIICHCLGLGQLNIAFIINTSAKLTIHASSNGTSWDILTGETGTTTLTANTEYYVKYAFNGSAYSAYLSTDNSTWTTEITYTSSTPIASSYGLMFGSDGTNGRPIASIDLNETYINIDGERWWTGLKQNYLNTSTTPANLYINGSQNNDFVKIGECAISAGAVTAIKNNAFNENGYTGSSIGMPSDTYKDLTLGANGSSYTAPANGWFVLRRAVTASGDRVILTSGNLIVRSDAYGASGNVGAYIPVYKGNKVVIYYVGGTELYFRFVYAKGSESEAL